MSQQKCPSPPQPPLRALQNLTRQQIFFLPFFESLDRVPGVDCGQQIEHLGGNLQAWEQQRRDSEVEADA